MPTDHEIDPPEHRVTVARMVAKHWASHISDAGHRHALTRVMAALDGETDPAELGVDGPDADRIRAAVEPPTDPPSVAPQPPADCGGTTGAPDGTAILGRALRGSDGVLWDDLADGRLQTGGLVRPREYVERHHGPLTEVLLVSPAVARVWEAARRWRDAYGTLTHDPERESVADYNAFLATERGLATAVDAARAVDYEAVAEYARQQIKAVENLNAIDANVELRRRIERRLAAARDAAEADQPDETFERFKQEFLRLQSANRTMVLEPPDADRRREWAAALRWWCSRRFRALSAEEVADRIESGALTPWADTAAGQDLNSTANNITPKVNADDQRRCQATDTRLGQCELYDGHLDYSDPLARHRTGAILWADAAQIAAAPPLVSLAEPAPEPAGDGPGWERERVHEIIGFHASNDPQAFLVSEPGEVSAQLGALLATHDRQATTIRRQRQAISTLHNERDAARAELAEVRELASRWKGQADALTEALAEMTADRDRHRDQLAESRGDVMRSVESNVALGSEVADAKRELDRLRADHLLIPKGGVVGYRVTWPNNGTVVLDPDEVEIVLRGDLGQEGGTDGAS